jgi:hypothetical protein
MAIHLIHGCAPDWRPGTQVFRNFVPEEALRRFLERRPAKYGALDAAKACDVLTIDDSTKGAARAARIARDCGHEVTLFVNPHQIIAGEPYYFSVLNSCLDNRRKTTVSFLGKPYALDRELRAFRAAVKAVISRLPPQAALARVAEIADLLDCARCPVQQHAETLGLAELLALRDRGVRIENHGWAHQRIDGLTGQQLRADVGGAREWLRDTVQVESRIYAVPFGETALPSDAIADLAGLVVLADMQLAPGRVRDTVFNRLEITGRLQVEEAAQAPLEPT